MRISAPCHLAGRSYRVLQVVIFAFATWRVSAVPSTITVGGLFSNSLEERMFKFAVDYVNRKDIIGHDVTLDYIVNVTGSTDSFQNIQLACNQVGRGVVAIIGPMSSTAVKAVAPVSTALHIPQIAPVATNPHLDDKHAFPFLMRMMPADSIQSLALVDLVAYYGWKKMGILTSNTDYGVNGLVRFQSEAAKNSWQIYNVQRFEVSNLLEDIDAIAQLKLIKDTGVRIIILNCQSWMAREVLKQAEGLNMTGPGWAWVVTDGITGTNDVRVEGLIGVAPGAAAGRLYPEFSFEWEEMNSREGETWERLDAHSMLIADAVLAFAVAARNMYDDPRNDHIQASIGEVHCDGGTDVYWEHGHRLLQHIHDVRTDGVASYIQFGPSAGPLRPVYNIVNLKEEGWLKVGEWSAQKALQMTHPHLVRFLGGRETVFHYTSSLTGKMLNVATNEEAPALIMLTSNYRRAHILPHQVEGYSVDLLDKLASLGGFKYKLYLQEFGIWGAKNPITGQWNGLVEDLLLRKADICPFLTITATRERAVDFTMPYMDLGSSFVMKKPVEPPIRPFKFLDPFSQDLWMYILGTMVAVGAALSFFNKLSPNDYHGGWVYDIDPNTQTTSYAEWKLFNRRRMNTMSKMSFGNSLFQSASCLLFQGGEYYPKSIAGRITIVLWWLAIVIFTSTYTANLAAVMTASRAQTTINSVEDLAAQTKVSYATIKDVALDEFFRQHNGTLFKDMNQFMNVRKTHVFDAVEGFRKARAGGFAFILDRPTLEYEIERKPCDLKLVGRLFGKIGWGMALQKNSPYMEELSSHILQLRANGWLDQLRHKWYVQRGQCFEGNADTATTQEEEENAEDEGQLDYTQMLGVFYIIYGSFALSLVVVVGEWIAKIVTAVDKEDPCMPHSLGESIKRHLGMFKADFLSDWLLRLPSLGGSYHVEQAGGGPSVAAEDQGKRNKLLKHAHFSPGAAWHNNYPEPGDLPTVTETEPAP